MVAVDMVDFHKAAGRWRTTTTKMWTERTKNKTATAAAAPARGVLRGHDRK